MREQRIFFYTLFVKNSTITMTLCFNKRITRYAVITRVRAGIPVYLYTRRRRSICDYREISPCTRIVRTRRFRRYARVQICDYSDLSNEWPIHTRESVRIGYCTCATDEIVVYTHAFYTLVTARSCQPCACAAAAALAAYV
jgi:hypothetical protein